MLAPVSLKRISAQRAYSMELAAEGGVASRVRTDDTDEEQDGGPWPCEEEGCPAAEIGCADLVGDCDKLFDEVWQRPPEGLGGTFIWTRCAQTCSGGGWGTAWAAGEDDNDRCDVDVRANLSLAEFEERYVRGGRPVLLPLSLVLESPEEAIGLSSRPSFVHEFGDVAVPVLRSSAVTAVQYAQAAEGVETSALADFVVRHCDEGGRETAAARDGCGDDRGGDSERVCRAPPSGREEDAEEDAPYVFSSPRANLLHAGGALAAMAPRLALGGVARSSHFFDASAHRKLFFLGANGSGTFFHDHSNTFNLLLHGAKRWLLLPPSARAMHAADERTTVAAWLRRRADATGGSGLAPPLLSCTQHGGQALFIPSGWTHAVVNRGGGCSIGAAVEVGDRLHDVSWCGEGPLENECPHSSRS